jgi:chemotaxis signal transduction protein
MNTITSTDDIKGQDQGRAFKLSSKNKPYHQTRFFYTIGLFNFLLEENIKVENLYEFTVNKVPHAPEWCSGITTIRGNIMPVVNMHVFLKTGTNTTPRKKKLIMLEHKNYSPIVFEIDKLPEVLAINHYTTVKTPEKSPIWLKKALKNDTHTIYEINHLELLKQLKNS